MSPGATAPVVPAYNKPDAPGIWMNFDNSVAIYHVIAPLTAFDQAAQDIFELLLEAQSRFPDWPRAFYLDIPHHENEPDYVELQQEFWFSAIAPFLTSFHLPLTGPLMNPDLQRNDLPDSLMIQ